jgi:hypothetical protein
MGMLNAAVWLGAATFCTVGVLPVVTSHRMMELLGPAYFPYLSGSIVRIVVARMLYWQIFCAVIAWAHLILEWLYLGRTPRRFWVGLLTLLFTLSLMAGIWLNPRLTQLQRLQHPQHSQPVNQTLVAKSFRFWDGLFQAVNVVLIGGVGVYFWRLTTTEDAPRFVTPVKFRS